VKLVEVGLHDPSAGVAKENGNTICVAGAASMVGKRVKVRIIRVLDGTAYAELVSAAAEAAEPPITAEALAEKPTRARRSRTAAKPKAETEAEEAVAEEPEAEEGAAEEPPKRKRTRRGSRGGRRRKKKPVAAEAETKENGEPAAAAETNGEPAETAVLIHVPDPTLGSVGADEESADGAAPKKKRTRRGSRGGRRRRKTPAKAEGET
jgi:predicted RNA-binding protein with TRAM domain